MWFSTEKKWPANAIVAAKKVTSIFVFLSFHNSFPAPPKFRVIYLQKCIYRNVFTEMYLQKCIYRDVFTEMYLQKCIYMNLFKKVYKFSKFYSGGCISYFTGSGTQSLG